jgi:hypothetical protein
VPGQRQVTTGGKTVGKWKIEIAHGSGREAVDFDTAAGSVGWNSLGTFDLEAGEVRVELSDRTDAAVVFADAIRWLPARAAEVASR